MKPIDDYDLIDEDFEEFMRRGSECFEWEEKNQNGNKDILASSVQTGNRRE